MPPNQLPTVDSSMPGAPPESSGHLPEIASVLPWRTWKEGSAEAHRRGTPMLAFAEAPWANSAQRVALRLQQDDDLRDLVTSQTVPVLVDPEEYPDLVAAWRRSAMTLTGTVGPPLMVFLTHDGLPFLAYCTMSIEGDDTYPSLAALIESIAETYAADAERIVDEARTLASRSAAAAQTGGSWDDLRQRLDQRHGGLIETPKHPHPTLLWVLLDAHAAGDLPDDILEWLRATLDQLVRGGIWDQIDRGFHRCTRNDRWIVPHFEKPIPLNAQLAAVYARAGAELEDATYRDIASRTVSFCLAALGEDVDVIGSDTGYYTWTSKELLNTLDPVLVQVMTLHYDIKPVHERQALRRVVEMEQMDRFSHEDVEVLRTRLMRGRAQMRAARQRRPAPRLVILQALSWRAETVRWLLEASAWATVDVAKVTPALERLIDGRLNVNGRGYARSREGVVPAVWLEDQASLLAAFIAAHRVTEDAMWLERARDLEDILFERWWSDDGWSDQPGAPEPSRSAIDDVLPSTLGTLNDALRSLGELTGQQRYADRAAEASAMQRSAAVASDHWSASLPVEGS